MFCGFVLCRGTFNNFSPLSLSWGETFIVYQDKYILWSFIHNCWRFNIFFFSVRIYLVGERKLYIGLVRKMSIVKCIYLVLISLGKKLLIHVARKMSVIKCVYILVHLFGFNLFLLSLGRKIFIGKIRKMSIVNCFSVVEHWIGFNLSSCSWERKRLNMLIRKMLIVKCISIWEHLICPYLLLSEKENYLFIYKKMSVIKSASQLWSI